MPVQQNTAFFWKVENGKLCIGITPAGFGRLKQGGLLSTDFEVPQSVLGMQVELLKKREVPAVEQEAERNTG